MIIYYSMIAWVVIVAFAYALYQQRSRSGLTNTAEVQPVPRIWAIITFAYIVFWVGIRSGFVDTAAYILGFEASSSSLADIKDVFASSSKSPGFSIFQIVFKSLISSDYHFFLMAISIFQGYFVMETFRKYSDNFFFSTLLFFLSMDFTWMLNGIRQFIAVVAVFACIRLIEEKKWFRYCIVVLLASTVHTSALIMLPLYWIVSAKPWSIRVWLTTIAFVLCMLFADRFTSILEDTLANSAYAENIAQFAYDDGVNPLRLLVALVPVGLAFLCRHHIEADKDSNRLGILVNMSVLCAGLYLIGITTSGIMIGRLPIYFELSNFILLPCLFNRYFTVKSKRLLYLLCIFGYGLWFYIQRGGLYYVSEITGVI